MPKSKKAKKAKKQVQPSEEQIILAHMLHQAGKDRLLQHLILEFQESVYDLDCDIENELHYAEHETDSYREQKKEAKRVAKHLQKVRDTFQTMVDGLQEVAKTKAKLNKQEDRHW